MRSTPIAQIEFHGLAPVTRDAAPPPRRRPGARDYQLPGRGWTSPFDGIACLGALRPIVFLHLADEIDFEPEEPPASWLRLH